MVIFDIFSLTTLLFSLFLQLIKRKPCLVFLLRKTAVVPLTKAKLIKLLRPRFSEEGSNQRQQENSVDRIFLEYLKEVTGERVRRNDRTRFFRTKIQR